MGSTRHEKSFVTFEKGYEQNILGLRGIVYFGIGLILLIVITFFLMWALLKVFAEDRAADEAGQSSPMALSDRERLPPEPRLQLAPGFGIDAQNGRENLELRPPSSEYQEFRKQWFDIWKNGEKDKTTGAVAVLPIEEAKQRLLSQAPKATSDPNAQNYFDNSRLYYSDASSGRVESLKRR
ncbi:MAG TPA: hypothetical protein VEV84_15850 [Pyrinomonadaceae bacterium]|nr:hypothetical protein [Pyrinomonadaceae bacterium]